MQGLHEHIGDDGAISDGFVAAIKTELGDDYAGTKYFDDFKDIVSLAKAGCDTRRKNTELTQNAAGAITKPPDNATDEQKAAYMQSLRTELGASSDAAAYQFEPPTDLPEGMAHDPDGETKWAEIFRDAGIATESARQIVAKLRQGAKEVFLARQRAEDDAHAAAVKVLTDANTPDQLAVMGRGAALYLAKFGNQSNQEQVAALNAAPADFAAWRKAGFSPSQVKHMAGVADKMKAGVTLDGGAGPKTPDAEQAERDFVNACNAKSPGMLQPAS
jgi:hypothetical protein